MMPWVHFHITQQGTVTPCCKTSWLAEDSFGNINEQGIAEIWNDEPIKAFRQTLLHDEPDKRCTRCYKDDKVGKYSLRQVTNDNYGHYIERLKATQKDGTLQDFKPIYWDIRFSNLCNFKCRICGYWASSKWYADAKALGVQTNEQAINKSINNYNEFLTMLSAYLPYMEEIYFAGGEPLIMDEHLEILRLLQKNGKTDVTLRYNTNFSTLTYKGVYFPDIWKQFKKVLLCASLDDQGKAGELQRKGLDWKKVIDNRVKLLAENLTNVDFMLTPTLSVFNIYTMPSMHQDWVAKGLIDVADCWPHTLDQPEYYNIKILPKAMKSELQFIYKHYKDWIKQTPSTKEDKKQQLITELDHCLQFMEKDDWQELLPVFKEKTAAIDRLRNEDAAGVHMYLKELLE